MAPITAAQSTWISAFTTHTAAQASAKGASQAKDAARLSFEAVLRALVVRLQARVYGSTAENTFSGFAADITSVKGVRG